MCQFLFGCESDGAYSVVKFIVTVRLIDIRVNSHVGRVIVVKARTQYSAPGITLSTARTTRPRKPNDEGLSRGAVVSKAPTVLAIMSDAFCESEAEASAVAMASGSSS